MASRKLIRAITLDMTGTVVEFGKSVGHTYLEIFRKHANRDTHGLGTHDAVQTNFIVAYKELRQQHPFYGGASMSTTDWWHRCIRNTFALCGVRHVPQAAVEEIYTIYERPEAYLIYPDAIRALNKFREQGVVLGIITNADERYDVALLPNMGIRHYFDFVIHAKTHYMEKPAPQIFQHAHSLVEFSLGKRIEPAEIAHIGDDIQADYHGAREYGFQAFLLDRKGQLKAKKGLTRNRDTQPQSLPHSKLQKSIEEIPDALYRSFDEILTELALCNNTANSAPRAATAILPDH